MIDSEHLASQIEASQDIHSDAMRLTRDGLREVVEEERSARREFIVSSARTATTAGLVGLGAFLASKLTPVVSAATPSSTVQTLQTAAALENLAVAVYTKAAGLPPAVSGADNPVILTFVKTTIQQHTEHAQAFNNVIAELGGAKQTGIDDTVYKAVVVPALGKIAGPADVVSLALTLEDAAAQSYIAYSGSVAPKTSAFKLFATIAPVEAQHVAILRAVQALLAANAPSLIALPPNAAALPAAAGSVGIPTAFYPDAAARPATEATVA